MSVGLVDHKTSTAAVRTVFPGKHKPAGTSKKRSLAGAATTGAGRVLFFGGLSNFGHCGLFQNAVMGFKYDLDESILYNTPFWF